jgi:DNA polymerase I-like protein with 3'-5' exonuclease and polymerase domains
LPDHVSDPDPFLYWRKDYVVIDFETTTIHKGSPLVDDNKIVMASWREGGGKLHSHFGSEFEQAELVRAVERSSFIVAHNAKFELGWLRRCGVDLRSVIVYDTMIGEYVLGGNRFPMTMLSLANSLKRYKLAPKEDLIGLMFKAGIDTLDMPKSWLQSYCERDVAATEELFLLQREKLNARGLIHLQYQRCLLTPVLADIELNGMQLDEQKVDKEIETLEDDYAKITSELQEFMQGVPPSSTKQKGEYVFNVLNFAVPKDHRGKPMLTKSGAPSIAAEVLLRLRARTAKQRKFLELHSEWAKMHSDITKYLRKFKICCEEADGELRAVFNQCATRTHRLSSSGMVHKVQFQNLNRKFKPIFKARHPDWLVGEADGAQLEFRIAIHMSRDKQGYYDIVHGVDIHRFTASIINLVPEDQVTGEMRQAAKPDTFKPTYGGTSGTDAQRRYYEAFKEKYHQLATTQRGWTHKVLEDKKLLTEYGLILYWPDCKMTQSGWVTYTTNIYNYPIQGFATAEIIPLAMICAWHRMQDMESFLVNTVHDSIIAELHPEEVDLWHEIGKQCLIEDAYMLLEKLYGIKLTVPLGAGVMVSTHWADKKAKESETVYEADPKKYEAAAKEAGML